MVALKLRSLRFHSPRLCRAAVFQIQTNVSLSSSHTLITERFGGRSRHSHTSIARRALSSLRYRIANFALQRTFKLGLPLWASLSAFSRLVIHLGHSSHPFHPHLQNGLFSLRERPACIHNRSCYSDDGGTSCQDAAALLPAAPF